MITGGTTLFSASRGYDAVGNVTSVTTTLAAGTDNQAFCYDEQNRLVWAGSTGTPSCGGTLSAGTLTSAYYTSAFSYDAQNRLTSNTTQGSYTYGDPAHLHAATATSSGGYSGSYDAAGDLICRAPTSATTCSGSPTGAQLGYDNERRLIAWQNAPGGSPTTTASYAYDGEGQRVAQRVTSGGTTTTTDYLAGGLEEQTGGTITKYESVPGMLTAVNIAGTITYLAQDGLGSVTEALSSTGSVTASQLYGPYGGVRYSSGVMPTAKGYTGQYADAASSGLDYYNARYYDPALGQFASADSDSKGGLNRYGYVAGNPETATDPSGHQLCNDCDGGGGEGCTGKCGEPPCWPHCGGSGGGKGGSGGDKPKKKGLNGCIEDDTACQGAKAQQDARNAYQQIDEQLIHKLGEVFADWVDSHFNLLTMLKDMTLDTFLDWLGGSAAKTLWAGFSHGANAGFELTMFIPWLMSWWESNQSAAWFQSTNNIADFGHAVLNVEGDAFDLPALAAIGAGLILENPELIGAGIGLMDATDLFDTLDESVIEQLYEFDPFPPIIGGSEHLLK